MSTRFNCPAGHQWEPADDSAAPAACPVCGAAPEAPGTSSLISNTPLGSRPNLGQPEKDDPAATIAATDERADNPEFDTDGDPTLTPGAAISENVRLSVPGYEIMAELGRGGMGVVYKALDIGLRRLVALKMVISGVHVGQKELMRFRSEASAVAGLQHLHIVQIYEVGEHEGRPYFSLEFVEGGTLAQKLKSGTMPARAAAELMMKLARAVHFAHQRGIVHRDLKPANIMLTVDGQPKITDFGLAKQTGADLTHSGTVMGTPSYMAPEQAMGRAKNVGPAADIYAMGAILYEMLCGRPPFRAETSLDTMLQVASEEPVPLSRLQPKLPPDLPTICHKCLLKEPHKRYATAEDLANDLERFVEGEPIEARPVGTAERVYKWAKRRPALATMVALTVLMIVLAFAGLTWEWQSEAKRRTEIEAAQRETENALARAEASLYSNRIALAEREWLANNLARARHLLLDCPPAMRQWEWHYLNRLCHGDLLTLRGHDSALAGIVFSPDGRYLASASTDQTVKVWDTLAGKVLMTQSGPSSNRSRAVAMLFSPDGKQLFFAGGGPETQTWEIATTKQIRTARWPVGKIACSAFSPDHSRLASGSYEGPIAVWDPIHAKEVTTLRGHNGQISGLAFGPKGKYLASAGHDGTARIWDASNGAPIALFNGHTGSVNAVAFSFDGRRVASGGNDTTVKVWEPLNGRLIATFRGHQHPVNAIAFSPDGQKVASAGKDQVIKVWNASTGELMHTIRGHTNRITFLSFSPDGKVLASAGEDHVVKLWDAGHAQEARGFRARFAGNCLAIAPDGQRLATADNVVQIWDFASTRSLQSFGGSGEIVRGLAFDSGGTRLVTAGSALKLRDPANGRDLLVLRGSGPHDRSVAFTPDGKQIISGGDDGTLRIWDATTGKEVAAMPGHSGSILSVAVSPDGALLASASSDRKVKIWEAATGRLVRTLEGHSGRVNSVAFCPMGKYLASGAEGEESPDSDSPPEGELKLWDVATGELRFNLLGHSGTVNGVAFSPDGARLASASDDLTLKVWDPALGQEALTLRGHVMPVQGVVFSPDGTHLISISVDQAVRIWNASPLQ